jgi:hypothetical protein
LKKRCRDLALFQMPHSTDIALIIEFPKDKTQTISFHIFSATLDFHRNSRPATIEKTASRLKATDLKTHRR